MAANEPGASPRARASASPQEAENMRDRVAPSPTQGHGVKDARVPKHGSHAGGDSPTPSDASHAVKGTPIQLAHARPVQAEPPATVERQEKRKSAPTTSQDAGTRPKAATSQAKAAHAQGKAAGTQGKDISSSRAADDDGKATKSHKKDSGTPPTKEKGSKPSSGGAVLSHNEVAAVSMDRSFYVSDKPSPYLSSREAQEDISVTRRRHNVIMILLTLALVVGALGGIAYVIWQTMFTRTQTVVTEYNTAPIVRGEFVDSVDATALVRPINESAVMPTVLGKVKEILVPDGANVNEGDPLFILENEDITKALENAKTALDAAQATADEKNLALDELNATISALEAAANSTAEPDSATLSALASSENKLVATQVEADAANATLKTIQETYDRAQEQVDALTITAPITGTVNGINTSVPVGTEVSPSVRLCMVSDVGRYCVDVEIPPTEENRVTQGREVRLTFPTIPDLSISTIVESIHDEGSIKLARIAINDPDPRIGVGTQVNVSVIMQSIPDSLIVPLRAVRIADDGTAHLDVLIDPSRGIDTDVPVTVIATNATQAAITAANIQVGNAVILINSTGDEQV